MQGCKTDFYKTCARELTALCTLLQSPFPSPCLLPSITPVPTAKTSCLLFWPCRCVTFNYSAIYCWKLWRKHWIGWQREDLHIFLLKAESRHLVKSLRNKAQIHFLQLICASRQDFKGTVQAFCFSVERCKAYVY